MEMENNYLRWEEVEYGELPTSKAWGISQKMVGIDYSLPNWADKVVRFSEQQSMYCFCVPLDTWVSPSDLKIPDGPQLVYEVPRKIELSKN